MLFSMKQIKDFILIIGSGWWKKKNSNHTLKFWIHDFSYEVSKLFTNKVKKL